MLRTSWLASKLLRPSQRSYRGPRRLLGRHIARRPTISAGLPTVPYCSLRKAAKRQDRGIPVLGGHPAMYNFRKNDSTTFIFGLRDVYELLPGSV